MGTRRNTTAGVPLWTPAPIRTSPTCTETCDDVWEGEEDDGEEEQEGSEDDFSSQMDENGIIGLSEVLEDVEMREPPVGRPGSLTQDTHLQETHSQTGSVRQDPPSPSSSGVRWWTEDEELRWRTEQQRAEQLDVTDEEEEVQTSETYKHEQSCTSRGVGVSETGRETSLTRSWEDLPPHVEPVGVSKHKLSESVPAFSHLLHFTSEEFASAPGIDAETFPEISFLGSLPNSSSSSHTSIRSSSCLPQSKIRASAQPAKRLPEQASSKRNIDESESPGKRSEKSHKQHKPPPLAAAVRNMRMRSHEDLCSAKAKTASVESKQRRSRSPNEANQYRTGALIHQTPDLSKVEAKVHFPKRGYKPPKSRLPKRTSLAPEAPLVFKSPADIVKEVLLNTTDKAAAPSSSVAVSTMPQDFRSRQQATSLLEQLQEDYNRLLTKYAAAENTIDRLRLEAKVNLYSDPPTAGHCVQSAVSHDALKLIQLDFPQSSRAEVDSADVPPNEQSAHQVGLSPSTTILAQLGKQLSTILLSQADLFLQQLQTFENLLKYGKLKPPEQVASLSHLAEGLESLEKSYLLTRDEYKLQHQRGKETSLFDPDRELEDLVFQCGLHLEALKEEVEQKLQEVMTCDVPHQPTPPSSPQRGGTPTHPQSPLQSSLHDPGDAAELELSSFTKDADEEEAPREESLLSVSLKPLKHECRRSEPDCVVPFDHDQRPEKPPKHLTKSKKQRLPSAANSQRDFQAGEEKLKDERREGGTKTLQNSVALRKVPSDRDSSPSSTIQHHRGSSPESGALTESTPPAHPGLLSRGMRGLEGGRSPSSSLSSMADGSAAGRRSSKSQNKSRRVLSQDGIISPEMDSGFIGSESSRVTPAAPHSPVQQRAAESVSVFLLGNSRHHQQSTLSHLDSGAAPAPTANPRLASWQPRSSVPEPRRQNPSCSPRHWMKRSTVNVHTESESDLNDRYTDSTDSFHPFVLTSSSALPSPAALRHHGDHLATPSSAQAPLCNNAIHTLQTDVIRLKERVERVLRSQKQSSPSSERSGSRPRPLTPRFRSAERQSHVSEARGAEREKRSAHGASSRSGLKSTPVQSHAPQTPHVSRSTQTSVVSDAAVSGGRRTQHRRPPDVSLLTSDMADESDSRSHTAPPRGRRVLRHRRSQHGGDREPSCSSTPSSLSERPEPGRYRLSHQAAGRSPEKSTQTGHVAAAAPPALLSWQSACPPQILLYPTPLDAPLKDSPSGVRGHRTKESSVDDSLNRAIRAARHMKHTSRHMARRLQAGLQHQQLLAE